MKFFIQQEKNSKCKIWEIFSIIHEKYNEIVNGFVYCQKFNHLFKYNGKQKSNLIRHICYVKQNSNIELKK